MEITAEKKEEAREFFTTVAGVEYCVDVRRGVSNRNGGEYWWVDVKQYQPDLRWWKSIFSESSYDCENEMEAMHYAFKRQRGRMREWLQSWLMHRQSAAAEKGGKRAYYTKWANKAHKIALEYAPKWRLCKQLWKGITKL